MATQPSLLGLTTVTVDAISFTPIYPAYAPNQNGQAFIEAGSVNVTLRTDPNDSTHEKVLLASDKTPILRTFAQRGQLEPGKAPVVYAKSTSGTTTVTLYEY